MLAILLILIFIRPFISSLAFPYLNYTYSFILLGFLIIWLIHRGLPIEKIKTLKPPLILFLLALFVSITFSKDRINSLKELYKYISSVSIFLFAISLSHKDRDRVIRTIVLSGFIISLLAIYQYFFGFRHILDYSAKEKIILSSFALDYIQQKRVFFPFVTPNTLGGYLAMIIPLILALLNKKNFLLLVSVSFALLLTKSLGALLSLFLGLVIYFYLQGKLEKRRFLFFFGLLVIIGLVFITRSTVPKYHLQPIFSTTMRLSYWKDTLKIIKTSPLFGIGLGNFNLVSVRYAHNSYLQIWAEAGILGIFSILWLISVVLKSAIKNIGISPNKKLTTGLITANTIFLIHNIVDFSFFLPEVAIIWWTILGLAIHLPEKRSSLA